MQKIKFQVFLPPFLLLLGAVILNFVDQDTFISLTTNAHHWILNTFGWQFSLGAFLMFVLMFVLVLAFVFIRSHFFSSAAGEFGGLL